MDDDNLVEATVARFREVARRHVPRSHAAAKTGATRWVRELFEQIAGMREAEWAWSDVACVFNAAAVPLEGGKPWSAKLLCRLYQREEQARAGRGTKRTGKAARESAPASAPIPAGPEARAGASPHPLSQSPPGTVAAPPVPSSAEEKLVIIPRRGISLYPPGREPPKLGIQKPYDRGAPGK